MTRVCLFCLSVQHGKKAKNLYSCQRKLSPFGETFFCSPLLKFVLNPRSGPMMHWLLVSFQVLKNFLKKMKFWQLFCLSVELLSSETFFFTMAAVFCVSSCQDSQDRFSRIFFAHFLWKWRFVFQLGFSSIYMRKEQTWNIQSSVATKMGRGLSRKKGAKTQ